MITSKLSLGSGFDCIIRPAPLGAGRTTPSQPGHYPLINNLSANAQKLIDKSEAIIWREHNKKSIRSREST